MNQIIAIIHANGNKYVIHQTLQQDIYEWMLQRYFVVAAVWINSWGERNKKKRKYNSFLVWIYEWFSVLAEEASYVQLFLRTFCGFVYVHYCVFKPCVCVCVCVFVHVCSKNCLAPSWFHLAGHKRVWDMQGFINNHCPHEKLIHSGLENRHDFPPLESFWCKASFKITHSLLALSLLEEKRRSAVVSMCKRQRGM